MDSKEHDELYRHLAWAFSHATRVMAQHDKDGDLAEARRYADMAHEILDMMTRVDPVKAEELNDMLTIERLRAQMKRNGEI